MLMEVEQLRCQLNFVWVKVKDTQWSGDVQSFLSTIGRVQRLQHQVDSKTLLMLLNTYTTMLTSGVSTKNISLWEVPVEVVGFALEQLI